jgi:RNA polymerase sigma factor (sigma-70 family)
VLHHLRRLTGRPDAGIADAQLLHRFVADRDEAAFELLLWRHGPMVRAVCLRVLRHAQDAEDAFQATFLALVRKAGSIDKREALGGWLYRVAYRVALRAREMVARRSVDALTKGEAVAADVSSDLVWRDLRPVLDEEVNRLPEKYRLPIILCYLQGQTYEQAAREIGCPKGTLSIRLQRARELLHARLTRRGLTLSAGMLTAALTASVASATVPAAWAHGVLKAALLYAAGQAATGAVSAQVVSLTEGVLRSMYMTKLKQAAVILLAMGLIGLGAGLFPRAMRTTATEAEANLLAPVPENKSVVVNIPAQRDGILLFIATEIKEGEEVPADQIVTIKVDGETKKYRRLKEGDKVEDGQLLARVDDRLARDDVAIKEAKLEVAEAELRAATKSEDEAKGRFARVQALQAKNAVGQDEFAAAKLTWERYVEEVSAKSAVVKQAKREVKSAQTIVEMHEIRAVRGTIKAILKQPREAVKSLETVFQIQTEGKATPKEPEKDKPKEKVPADPENKSGTVGPDVRPSEKGKKDEASHTDENVRFVNSRCFQLEYEIDNSAKSKVERIIVWMTEDGAKTWKVLDRFPPNPRIPIQVKKDGRYGFRLDTESAMGGRRAEPKAGDPPQIWIEVNETKPEVSKFDVSVGKEARKKEDDMDVINFSWTVTGKNLTDEPITLFFGESVGGPWKAIAGKLPNNGQYTWSIPKDFPAEFVAQIQVVDRAGNIERRSTTNPVFVEFKAPKVRVKDVKGIKEPVDKEDYYKKEGGKGSPFGPKE